MIAKLHKWHRRIGLIASAFIIFLAVTGIVLQHSDELELPKKFLSNGWLLKYYGIKPNPITTYQLGNQTISHAGETLYLSGNPIDIHAEASLGAVLFSSDIVIATPNALIVVDHDGNVIDEITTQDGLHETPLGIALSVENTLVMRGVNTYWESDLSLTKWLPYKGPHPKWIAPSMTLPALKQVIEKHDMGQQISLERFILDAHSGRFFGRYGVYVIDAAAILLMILAISGIWLWFTRRQP